MEWIDCKGMTYKELEEIRCRHKGEEGNRVIFMYEDGSMQSVAGFYGAGAPVKYLLTSAHPNASMIAKYISAMRPVYLDGLETRDPMAAMDTPSSDRLSFLPPKKTATIKYRQYLWLDKEGFTKRIVNCNRFDQGFDVDLYAKEVESLKRFVRWIDDDWVTEEVEL